MKYLIILDDNSKYDNTYANVSSWNNDNMYELIFKNDFSFINFDDSESVDDIKKHLVEKNISIEDNVFYIVLHHSAIEGKEKEIVEEYENCFNTQNVKYQSHIPGDFYYTKMPSLISNENITFAEVADGFFESDREVEQNSLLNQKLTFLHKLLGNKLNEMDIAKNLKEFNCSISFNRDDKNASIIAIRNAILKS